MREIIEMPIMKEKRRLADPIEKFFPEELASEQYRAMRRGQTDITGRASFQEAETG